MKVIYITKCDLFGDINDGGRAFAYRWYEILVKLAGVENVKVCVITPESKKSTNTVKYITNKHRNSIPMTYMDYLFLRDGMSRKVEKEIIDYVNNSSADIVFFDSTTFGRIIKKFRRGIKTIVLAQNLEKQYSWNTVVHKSPLCIFHFFSVWYNEHSLLRRADRLVCLNNRDSRLFSKHYHRKADLLIPMTFKDVFSKEAYEKVKSNKEKLVFVGSNFMPNIKGIEWFIRNVMPYIGYELEIVGRNMENWKPDLSNEKVKIVGSVDDLAPYYYDASAIVMPIFIGAGMKVKSAEALMYGKTIFATKEALEGYDVKGSDHIFKCNTKEEFISAIQKYMASENKVKMNEDIRELFLKKYENSAVERRFFNMIERL